MRRKKQQQQQHWPLSFFQHCSLIVMDVGKHKALCLWAHYAAENAAFFFFIKSKIACELLNFVLLILAEMSGCWVAKTEGWVCGQDPWVSFCSWQPVKSLHICQHWGLIHWNLPHVCTCRPGTNACRCLCGDEGLCSVQLLLIFAYFLLTSDKKSHSRKAVFFPYFFFFFINWTIVKRVSCS